MEVELTGSLYVFDFMSQCVQHRFQQVMYKVIRNQKEFGYKKSKNNFEARKFILQTVSPKA